MVQGVLRTYPEVDRVEWTPMTTTHVRLLEAQHPFLERLHDSLGPDDDATVAEDRDRPRPG